MKPTHSLIAAAILAAAGAAQAQSATYAVDPSHTFVTFEAKHFGTSTIRGRFDKKEGSVTLDKTAKTGSGTITIDMTSVSTGVPALDSHLKKDDFFNAEKYPTAKFAATKFNFDGAKVKTIDGTLTLRDKTQPVTLTASNFNCYENPMLKREVCGGDFETTLTRSQYDVKYGLPGIPDNIKLLIQIEAVKQ
jgi:polyisoprenoid-binding protein YceI